MDQKICKKIANSRTAAHNKPYLAFLWIWWFPQNVVYSCTKRVRVDRRDTFVLRMRPLARETESTLLTAIPAQCALRNLRALALYSCRRHFVETTKFIKKPSEVYYALQYANLQFFCKFFGPKCLELKVLQVQGGRFLIGFALIFKNPA